MVSLQREARARRTLGGVRGSRAAAVAEPLRIVAEGDSWFDYPPFEPFGSGGIVPRLSKRLGVPILNLATAGDEVRYMLGVTQRKRLTEVFRQGSPAGGPWDALLFSGGGNDIVDDPMALWVRDFERRTPPEQLVHQPRFTAALALVRAGYEDLIALRDDLSPGTHLFFHTYDFAIPTGEGICHLGPWLEPTFTVRGFPKNGPAAFGVVKVMLLAFADVLAGLQQTHPATVTVVNGQGTLEPKPSSWHNELHPKREGFDRFADLFRDAILARFPGRVP